MQLTKLRLTGFKSFVDPTDLVIAPGLTGVVGPNGCGKSNLLEALRWVMGENRPTQMRGAGMEDVIFAGAETRAAKNFAEVSLHIDNRDRHAPAQFNHEDEIDVIRRITRDLGSNYKINGKEVRARDISMMFADAATGAHSPSLVRQGQISELINAKPKNRRRVLEDAAGISGLYQRRHEAELRLKGAEANLTRVDDIIEQLASQMRSLERQAKAAARYKDISRDLRALEAILLYQIWRQRDEERLAAEATKRTRLGERSEAERARLQAERALTAAQDAMAPLREEDAIAAALVQRLSIAFGQLDDEDARVTAEIEGLEAAAVQIARDSERESQIASDADKTLERLAWEKGQLETAREGEDEKIAKASEDARLHHERLQGLETRFDEARQDVARLDARAQAAEKRIRDAQARKKTLEDELESSRAESLALETNIADAKQRFDDTGQEITRLETALSQGDLRLQEAEARRQAAQNKQVELRESLAAAKGEESAIRAEAEGLRSIFERSDAERPALDEIVVEAGFEAAIGAAFDDDLSAAIDETNGWRNLPAFEFAALPEGVKTLASVVQAPGALSRRLNAVGIVDAARGAELQTRLAQGQRLVSKAGDLWRWDGFVRPKGEGATAAQLRLEQQNRLRMLDASLADLRARRESVEVEFEAAKTALLTAETDEKTTRTERRESERALTEAIRVHNQAENEFERLKSRRELLAATKARREEDLALIHAELEDANAHAVSEDDLESAKSALEVTRAEVEGARIAMMSQRAIVDDLRKDRDLRVRRLADIARETETWTKRKDNTATHKTDLAKRAEKNRLALEEALKKPDEISQKRAALQADHNSAERRQADAKEALATGERALRNAEQAFRDAETKLSDAREALARIEVSLENMTQDTIAAREEIEAELDITPEALGARLVEKHESLPAQGEVEAEIQRLKRVREAIGAVNLRAEEDRAEIVTEHDALIQEQAEITEAISKLRQGIASLNKEGRERLLAAFDDVNRNFKSLFRILFGGGEARLELVESDDPLDAGLEIMCQPPGKKLATLSLLSGGEQTLTALSLIFAVFLVNPSPICVLDEVDAPLDDANVTRFCDLLREMTEKTDTRFLIITHHAVTMSRMDRLFGVTMAEKGVSQLVSVDLGEAEKLVAE